MEALVLHVGHAAGSADVVLTVVGLVLTVVGLGVAAMALWSRARSASPAAPSPISETGKHHAPREGRVARRRALREDERKDDGGAPLK